MTSGVTPGPGGREKSGRREACLIGERLDYATGTIFAIKIPYRLPFKDLLLLMPILSSAGHKEVGIGIHL